jgi:tol-pal system protein YbgF
MKLSSKFLIGVVIGAGGWGFVTLSSLDAAAQTRNSNPSVSPHVAQVPLQSRQSGTVLARMSLQITQLENEIRRLTGQNEELTHRLGQLEELLKTSTSDTSLRLKALESRGGSAGAGITTMAQAGASTASGPNAAVEKSGKNAVRGADKGAKVLGTLRSRSGDKTTRVARVARPPSVVKAETPEQQYDRAHSLIVKQRKYGEAERVLRRFIDGNPKHALASNAHYWLGRTFFVRADYENAAFAFAEGFQKFPEAKKAPANLLNLGMSLARLGKNREACTTYTRLLRTYKDAEDSIKRRITRERRRAKCRSR